MKIKIFMTVLVMSCATFCAAHAESVFGNVVIKYDRQNSTVTEVSGDIISDSKTVALIVLNSDTDIDKLNSGEVKFKDCGIYADETSIENDKFIFGAFKIKKDNPADYSVRISDGNNLYEGKIYYASVNDTFALISNKADSADIKACIEKYNDSYGLSTDGIFSNLTDGNKELVYSGMRNKSYTTASDVQQEFNVQTVMAKINQGPWGELESIIKAENDDLKLNLTKFLSLSQSSRDSVIKVISGKSFKDTTELQTAINSAISSLSKSGTTGSGSGSTSTSSNKNSGTVVPTLTLAAENSDSEDVFTDLSDTMWARDSIESLYKRNIVSGRGDGTFAPNDSITRSEAVKMIICAYDIDLNSEECGFSDIQEENWAYKYICAASKAGIITGVGEGIFGGNQYITREDFVTILYRTLVLLGKTESISKQDSFSDSDEISDYAKQGVEYMQAMGIISGENGNFIPKRNISRAEVSVILWNCLK